MGMELATFIKLHYITNGATVILRVKHITSIDARECGSVVHLKDLSSHTVEESQADIINIITLKGQNTK